MRVKLLAAAAAAAGVIYWLTRGKPRTAGSRVTACASKYTLLRPDSGNEVCLDSTNGRHVNRECCYGVCPDDTCQ